jgi:serine/threonine protein kinase
MWVGTLAYAAPEQIACERVGAPADNYALGCVLHEMLVGHAAYERSGHARPPGAGGHVTVAHEGEIPPAFRAIIRCATAADPSLRFDSAGELARATRRAADDAGPPPEGPLLPPLPARPIDIDRGAPTAA